MSVQVVKRVEVSASTSNSHYIQNRAPLQPVPFQKLPTNAVQAAGWLQTQLERQINGLNGKLYEISDYLVFENCGWIDPTKNAWEEAPYWLRGFTELGYVTGNLSTLQVAQRWINAVLASQQSDGWFGPNAMRTSLQGVADLWPAILFTNLFRTVYECTNDSRIIPFLLKYFQFMSQQPVAVFQRGWGTTRWAENIDNIIWLYNRTTNSDWLIDLMHKIHANTVDWVHTTPTLHNVNFAQGFREPAFYSLVVNPPDPSLVQATYNQYQSIVNTYGQFPGGGIAGDEVCRTGYTDPRQGLETCGIVEFMHSFQMLLRVTGDGYWADRCEKLAFNSLPAAFDPFLARGTHYITCPNSIRLDDQAKSDKQFCDDWFPLLAYKPGVHQYRCCTHNHGIGWPYYTVESWLATYDGGLCASLYVPCQVTALVGPNAGTRVKIIEQTDYPYDGVVQFNIELSISTQFKLYLRVPNWVSKAPIVSLNGNVIFNQSTPDGGSFLIIDRLWTNGDSVVLTLPMSLTTQTWTANKNSISINYGLLTFSLAIQEQYNRIGGTDDWPEYEVLAQTNWNYGIIPSSLNENSIKRRKKLNKNENPFTRQTAPIELTVQGRQITNWTPDRQNVVGLLPQSPVASQQPTETLTLIPMGSARLRITAFPTIAK